MLRATFLGLIFACATGTTCSADEVPAQPTSLKVPEGFSIDLVAGSPIVERPIVAAFDDDGRLYVAESSGSNDPVQKQLEEKPHRVVRLEDTDGDGKFDKRIVYSDRLMFPEGALFFDGSLYVGAPPSIWKLTDKDGDGVAEERVEWFQGKTLTGCANDLHGPYAGPDGWIYWCKGAFAEQTHVVNGKEWKTKAAHIFRCRPDGSGLEPVLTGGMDNPVDVAFMPNGERILSGTFFHVNPRQDGLIHAIYGGVYGKENGVLEGHLRTGELMPILAPLSAAAGSGLERYDSDVFGGEFRDNLFLCQFNLRKVSRHILKPMGATYSTADSDFVWSDNVDFHPTDVVVDADGSLLVVDTGGWYKLCCPTSQLWKPDVLGGIYRVRKIGAKPPADPRGQKVEWAKQSAEQLWSLIVDDRPAVSRRATNEFVRRKNSQEMQSFVPRQRVTWNDALDPKSKAAREVMAHEWALSQLHTPESQRLLRTVYLCGAPAHIQHVALQSMSLNRDAAAFVEDFLSRSDSPATRRIAAEALGRTGDRRAVPSLLVAAGDVDASDRVLQHSIIYALIELADPTQTRRGLESKSPKTIAAALIALDQMQDGDLKAADVVPHLGASDDTLRQAASWVVRQHSDWGGELAGWLRSQMKSMPARFAEATAGDSEQAFEELLAACVSSDRVQQLIADAITSDESTKTVRQLALRVITGSTLKGPPPSWVRAIGTALTRSDAVQLPLALAAARRFPLATAGDPVASKALVGIVGESKYPLEIRIEALSIVVGKNPAIADSQFDLLRQALSADMPVTARSAAADAISKSKLSLEQLEGLCEQIESVGPLELNRLLTPFGQASDDALGLKLIASLKKSPAIASLRISVLREALAKYGTAVQHGVAELEVLVNVDAASQRKRIEELLPIVAKGDVRRGHAVFYSSKAACSSCHRLGAAGGTTGPELTHVGKTRTERDILESILYPSLSFVRSYEPMSIVTTDGKAINGVIRDETAKEYAIATGPDQQVRIPRDDVEQIQPSTVSIMPAGLDKQLSPQEIGDLVTFLKSVGEK